MKQPSPRPLSVSWIALVVALCAQAAIHGQLTFDERLSLGDVAH